MDNMRRIGGSVLIAATIVRGIDSGEASWFSVLAFVDIPSALMILLVLVHRFMLRCVHCLYC